MSNKFAFKTLKYIWSHPNCQQQQLQSICKFMGWQFYKRLTHRYLDIQLVSKVKMRCHPDSYSAAAALYCGLYDYDEMNFLLRYLQEEDSFLDIGANVGIYTLLAAYKIQSGSIYSFEALPKNYSRLAENLNLNNFQQVKSFAIAVSDSTGSIALNLAEGDSMPFITTTTTDNSIIVPTNTLDNCLQDQEVNNLTLAKIDIEGAEILAFKGATSLLKQQRPYVWILEINDTVNHFGHQKKDVVNFLQDYGYGLYSYNAKTNEVYTVNLEEKTGKNVLAIADSAIEFVRYRLAQNQLMNMN
jgi:FkbM family methyltransferase